MKSKKKASSRSFETGMERLQEIVDALETGDLSLEDGLALYKEGLACSVFCRNCLEKARHDIEIWRGGQTENLLLSHDGEEDLGPSDQKQQE